MRPWCATSGTSCSRVRSRSSPRSASRGTSRAGGTTTSTTSMCSRRWRTSASGPRRASSAPALRRWSLASSAALAPSICRGSARSSRSAGARYGSSSRRSSSRRCSSSTWRTGGRSSGPSCGRCWRTWAWPLLPTRRSKSRSKRRWTSSSGTRPNKWRSTTSNISSSTYGSFGRRAAAGRSGRSWKGTPSLATPVICSPDTSSTSTTL
mmetsp:Transcript_49817/g.144853  ORF Transcript_49817/g.144853 Transcript_49817/m.144853 type:complete len:208 (-) Transcript_49817:751-1374(-)